MAQDAKLYITKESLYQAEGRKFKVGDQVLIPGFLYGRNELPHKAEVIQVTDHLVIVRYWSGLTEAFQLMDARHIVVLDSPGSHIFRPEDMDEVVRRL